MEVHMITIDNFKEMDNIDKCNLVNKHLENHTAKTFKQADIGFTFKQAEAVLSECGIYKIEGIYRTSEQALDFIEHKKKEQDRKSFTPEQIEKLIELVSCDGFGNLINLAQKYNFVSDFILHERNDIQIQSGEGAVVQTTIRVYEDTWKKWKDFASSNKNFSTLNLLNTALLEFMDRHCS